MSELLPPSDFELWSYQQPGDFYEMSDGSRRHMYDKYVKQKESIAKLEADNKDLKARVAELANSSLGRIADLELFIHGIAETFGHADDPSAVSIVHSCNNVLNK